MATHLQRTDVRMILARPYFQRQRRVGALFRGMSGSRLWWTCISGLTGALLGLTSAGVSPLGMARALRNDAIITKDPWAQFVMVIRAEWDARDDPHGERPRTRTVRYHEKTWKDFGYQAACTSASGTKEVAWKLRRVDWVGTNWSSDFFGCSWTVPGINI